MDRRTFLKVGGSAAVGMAGAWLFPTSKTARALTGLVRLHPSLKMMMKGVDHDDQRIFGVAAGLLYQSEDWAGTWKKKNLPNGLTTPYKMKVIRWNKHLYLAGGIAASGSTKLAVWRALPASGTASFSWRRAFANTALGSTLNTRTTFGADSSFIYLGEYGDPQGGPSIYRSADGLSWQRTFGPKAGWRHIHAVSADPYAPGHVYATVGDGVGVSVIRSSNHGAAGSWVNVITPGKYQSVQISFDSERVWLAADSAWTNPETAFIFDRAALIPSPASPNYHFDIPVPGGGMWNRNAYFGAVDPATGYYYCVTGPARAPYDKKGMFVIPGAGEPVALLEGPASTLNTEVVIAHGRVWVGQWYRRLLSA